MEALADYQVQCNENKRLRKMQRDWSRLLHFTADDTGDAFTMNVVKGEIVTFQAGAAGSPDIIVSAKSEDLCDMFWGDLNPSQKYLQGEIRVKAPQLFRGYLDASLDAHAFDDEGFFRTGDLGVLDADGYVRITGRLKDVIIRGGENISAAEVEQVLEAHPGVRHAVAVGEPDALMGERVVAFVEGDARFDLDACRAWFAERGVAKFKTPERVVVVDALPLLPTGKPDRTALRARAAALAG